MGAPLVVLPRASSVYVSAVRKVPVCHSVLVIVLVVRAELSRMHDGYQLACEPGNNAGRPEHVMN